MERLKRKLMLLCLLAVIGFVVSFICLMNVGNYYDIVEKVAYMWAYLISAGGFLYLAVFSVWTFFDIEENL